MNIYEYHIFELRKYEFDRKKIITVIDTTFALVKIESAALVSQSS